MSTTRKIAINSIVLLICKIIYSILFILASLLIVRYLGKERYGKFSIVFAYLSFFQILTSLGIDQIVIKEISKDNSKQNNIIGNAIIMKIVFSVSAIFISYISLQFMGYTNEIKFFIYIASLSMLMSFNTIYLGLFQIHFKTVYYAIPELFTLLAFLIFTLLFIKLKVSVFYFIILQSFLIIPQTIIYIYFSKKISNFQPIYKIDFTIWNFLLKEAWPIFLTCVFSSVTMRIDQLILFKHFDAKTLGLYSAVVKLTEALNIIPGMFMVSIFPLLCSHFEKSNHKFGKINYLTFKYMNIISIPIAFGTSILSQKLIYLFYGNNFLPASNALSILIWAEPFIFFAIVNGSIFYASGMQKHVFVLSLFGAVQNLILNLLLIPKYGIVGASLSTVFTFFGFGFILQYQIEKMRQPIKDFFITALKPAICSAIMCIFTYFFYSLNIFLIIILSTLIYSFLLIVTGCIGSEDLEYLKQIINYKKKEISNSEISN